MYILAGTAWNTFGRPYSLLPSSDEALSMGTVHYFLLLHLCVFLYLRLPRMCAGFGVISWLLRDRDEGNDEGNQRHCFWVSCDTAPAARRSSIQFYQPHHGWRFIMDLVTFDSYLQCCGFSPFYFLNMVEVEMRLALDTLMICHLKVDIDYYDLLTKYVILKIDICYFY